MLRFLLGVVESGYFPGVILYLTFWYPQKHRARMVAIFVSANPLSGVIAGPISGAILAHMSGAAGLRAWQWLFLIEGIPSALAGIVTLFYLADNPVKAKWLRALAAVGILCGQTVFWPLPTGILSGSAAAAGIAWISSLGSLAGNISPAAIGYIRDTTGSMKLAQFMLSGSCLMASLAVLLVKPRQ